MVTVVLPLSSVRLTDTSSRTANLARPPLRAMTEPLRARPWEVALLSCSRLAITRTGPRREGPARGADARPGKATWAVARMATETRSDNTTATLSRPVTHGMCAFCHSTSIIAHSQPLLASSGAPEVGRLGYVHPLCGQGLGQVLCGQHQLGRLRQTGSERDNAGWEAGTGVRTLASGLPLGCRCVATLGRAGGTAQLCGQGPGAQVWGRVWQARTRVRLQPRRQPAAAPRARRGALCVHRGGVSDRPSAQGQPAA
jgi:hypothetical protein